MADVPPDWIPEDPEDHRWVTPRSPDCPDCECCTTFLCELAKERSKACAFLVGGAPDEMDVRKCPCAPLFPPLETLRADRLETT